MPTTDNRPNLNEFLNSYGSDRRQIIDVNVPKLAEDEMSPFIVLRYGDFTLLLNPMGMNDHLDLDVHPFVDGQPATVGMFGMTTGRRHQMEPTGSTSHGWPSAGMIALLVGEQKA